MKSAILILLCWTCVYVESRNFIPSVVQQMRTFDRQLNQLKTDIPQIERKLTNNLATSERTLRAELMTVSSLIDKRVRDVLADIFKDRSLEDMVSEISHVKMNNNVLKRQQQHMSRAISQLRKERTLGERRHVIKVPTEISENLELIVDDLLDGLSDTKDMVKELSADHSTLKTKHNELESSAENAWMRIETVENKTNLIESDVNVLNQEIAKIRVDTANIENLKLITEDLLVGLNDTKDKCKELSNDHSTLKTKHNELESGAENAWMRIETVENKTNLLKSDVKALNEKITKVRVDTSNNSEEMRNDIEVSARDIENLQLTTEDLLVGLNDTKDKVKELRDDHSTLKTKHNELESSAENVWIRIETVENKMNLLKSDVKTLNQEIAKVRVDTANIEHLELRTEYLLDGLNDTKDKVKELRDDHSTLKTRHNELESSAESVWMRIETVENKTNLLKRDVNVLNQEIAKIRVDTSNIEHLELMTGDLLVGLNDTKDKVKELSADHSTLKTKHNVLESSAEKAWMRIETVENKTNLLESDVKALNQEIIKVRVDASNNSEEVQGSFERVNQQNDQMENKTNMLNRDVTDLTNIMTKVRMNTSNNSNLIQRSADRLKQQTEQVQMLLKRDNETSKQFDLNEDRLKRFQYYLKFLKEQHAVRSRLLISSYFSSSTILHQLKLDGNQISTYPYPTATHIDAITYDPTNNAIVYSRYYRPGIYSTSLNGKYTSTLRANIWSYGLAIDEGRQLLFLTTYSPNKTVSRMRTDGKSFIAITDLSKYGSNPFGITLDTRNRMIYTSNHDKLFSLTYEGRSLQILYSGGGISGVALDERRGLLYFNNAERIMRLPLSGGSSVRVGEVDNYPRNMVYYNNTVYISEIGGNIYALHTNFNNDVLKKLTTMNRRSVICLIP